MKLIVTVTLILFCGSLAATGVEPAQPELCEAFVATAPSVELSDAQKRQLLLRRIVNANIVIPQNNSAIKVFVLGTILNEPYLLDAVRVSPTPQEIEALYARMERVHQGFGVTKSISVERVGQIVESYIRLIYISLNEVGPHFEPSNGLWRKLDGEILISYGNEKLLPFLPLLRDFSRKTERPDSNLATFGRVVKSVLNSDDFKAFANDSRAKIREAVSTDGIFGLARRWAAEKSARQLLRELFAREAKRQLKPEQAQFAQAIFSGLVAD